MKKIIALVVFATACVCLAGWLLNKAPNIERNPGLPKPGDVFTVATSPFQDEEFVSDYDKETLPALLPRLRLLPEFASGDPPPVMKEYRHQEGVIVLKNRRVLYFRAVFEATSYLKGKRVGWISLTPTSTNINNTRYYALP